VVEVVGRAVGNDIFDGDGGIAEEAVLVTGWVLYGVPFGPNCI
jgi:hypothetical protein